MRRDQIPDYSLLGRCEFPFGPLLEFAGKSLINLAVFVARGWLPGKIDEIPCSTGITGIQYPCAGSTWFRSGRPSSKRRMLSRMIGAAVAGLVKAATCGVTMTRGWGQN